MYIDLKGKDPMRNWITRSESIYVTDESIDEVAKRLTEFIQGNQFRYTFINPHHEVTCDGIYTLSEESKYMYRGYILRSTENEEIEFFLLTVAYPHLAASPHLWEPHKSTFRRKSATFTQYNIYGRVMKAEFRLV